MKTKSTLAHIRTAKGLTQHDLAKKSGVDQGSISLAERGMLALASKSAYKLAEALGVPVADLLVDDPGVVLATIGTRKIPVLDYIQAGQMRGVAPYFRDEEMQDHILTDQEYSARAFALTIRGDSMEPEFDEGDRVIVDPAIPYRPGDCVVAKDGLTGEATFAVYKPRGLNDKGKDYFELVKLNDNYPRMRSDLQPIEIVGPMVEHRTYRRKPRG